ncbi:MAG: hypothetical protein ACRD19_17510, partial [Terriglobia bacterium]
MRSRLTTPLLVISAVLGTVFPGLPALAQAPAATPVTQAQIEALQRAVQNAQSAGDNAWML